MASGPFFAGIFQIYGLQFHKLARIYGVPLHKLGYFEDIEQRLHGFEVKWSTKKRVTIPTQWQENYPRATFTVVTPDNYLDYIT